MRLIEFLLSFTITKDKESIKLFLTEFKYIEQSPVYKTQDGKFHIYAGENNQGVKIWKIKLDSDVFEVNFSFQIFIGIIHLETKQNLKL